MKSIFLVTALALSSFAFGDALEDLTKRVEALEKAQAGTWSCTAECKLWEEGYKRSMKGPFHASASTPSEALASIDKICANLRSITTYKNYFVVTAENEAVGATVKNACVH